MKDIKKEREKATEKFKGKLPQYLIDFFDEKELEQIRKEKEKLEESAITEQEDEDFWKNNKTEIIKKQRTNPKKFAPRYEEPPRAKERIEEEKKNPIDPKYVIAVGKTRLLAFAKYYFPHYLKKKSSEFHKFLYKILSEDINTGAKWAIAAPRGNAKSALVSAIFPLWCICYNKKKFIILLSDTAGQAEDFLTDIKRELEYNELLQRDFPHACGKGDTWRSDEIITNNNIKIKALGSGNKIRGRRFGIHRPDLIVCDDTEDAEMVRSDVQRTFIRDEWFNKDVLYVGGEEGASTDFFFVGTILGKHALLNALLNPSEYPDWKSKKFKAVIKFSNSPLWDEWERLYKNHFDLNREKTARKFFEDHKEEMLEGTEVLWPEGDPYYNLMVDKLRDPRGFVSEKQNEAVDLTRVYVEKKDLHWEDFNDPQIKAALNRASSYYYGALDPSLGKKRKRGDDSAIVVLARDPKTGLIFVIEMDAMLRSVDKQIDDILDRHEKYHFKKFGVETVAFQVMVADALRKKSRESGIYVPIQELPTNKDKKLRFEAVVPFLIDGTFIFDKKKYETDQLYRKGVTQICEFTGEDDIRDDIVDALGYAFLLAKKPRFKMLTSQNR